MSNEPDAALTDTQAIQSQVHLLTVLHRHGHDTWVHATEDGALSTLHAYVLGWWEETGIPPEETSASAQATIDAYFAAVTDESYTIEQKGLLQ